MARVILKKGEGRTVNAGGAWIYDNEVDRIEGEFENGGTVDVVAWNGFGLGVGCINTNSKIRVRMLTRIPGTVINDDFLRARVRDAIEYRQISVGLDSCRLIFGDADRLPGLTVDKFSDILVAQTLSLGMEKLKDGIFPIILDVLKEYGCTVRGIYERNDAKSRSLEGLERGQGFWREEFEPKTEIIENGLRYSVDVVNGQKTGFFLDQRFNRLAIRNFAKNERVLDCFCNAGGFALNAAAAGALEVTGVDASEDAVNNAAENAKLNRLNGIAKFVTADIFDYLPKLEEQGEKFGLVVLDPPAFAKSRSAVKSAMRGYREINRRGMALVKDGGYLATCTCSHFMTPELFRETVALAAKDAHKRLLQVEERAQAPDHPYLWGADESRYLTFLILRVTDEK